MLSNMLYDEFQKHLTQCPFCIDGNQWIHQNGFARLTYSLAPYVDYHMLVTPKRHVEHVSKLTKQELNDIFSALFVGISLLREKKIHDYSILVRNGKRTGRTVKHVHFHIIPKDRVSDLDAVLETREVLTKRQEQGLQKDLLRTMKKVKM